MVVRFSVVSSSDVVSVSVFDVGYIIFSSLFSVVCMCGSYSSDSMSVISVRRLIVMCLM